MAGEPILISNVGASSAPKTYNLPPSLDMDPLAVSATFDGTSASGAFLAALAFYSQDGLLLGRTFASSPIPAGSSASVTFAPNLVGDAAASGGDAILYKLISAATTNSTLVRAGAGSIVDYFLSNNATTDAYVKLYDKATAPTVGSDTPKWSMRIPALASANMSSDVALSFSLGIGLGITGGAADSDTTAVAANQVIVNLAYL